MVVLGPDGDDLAAAHADLHEGDEVGPRGVELLLGEEGAGTVRLDAVSEEQLAAVDVADSGDDLLVHQEGADRPAGLTDSHPREGGVGVAAQRIGSEPGDDVVDLDLVDDLADGGAPQVGAVLGADHPHPHLSDRVEQGQGVLGELAVEPEVDVHDRATLVVVEQVLAPRVGGEQHPSADRFCGVGETACGLVTTTGAFRTASGAGGPAGGGCAPGHALSARDGWRDVRLLVFGHDVDATLVPRRVRPCGGQEGCDE